MPMTAPPCVCWFGSGATLATTRATAMSWLNTHDVHKESNAFSEKVLVVA
jgi:hypothetical protein